MSAFRHGADRHVLGGRDISIWRIEQNRIRLTIGDEEHEFTADEAEEIGAALAESVGLLVSTKRALAELVDQKQRIEILLERAAIPAMVVKKP